MLFGKSAFQSILTRLDHEAPEEETVAAPSSFRIAGLNSSFAAPVAAAETVTRASHAYLDLAGDEASPAGGPDREPDQGQNQGQDREPDRGQTRNAAPPDGRVAAERTASRTMQRPDPPAMPRPDPLVMPPHLLRQTEAEVAEDLGLRPTDTAEALAEKRRAFARLNHPDGIHPAFRREATLRMTLANMLVDRARRLLVLQA